MYEHISAEHTPSAYTLDKLRRAFEQHTPDAADIITTSIATGEGLLLQDSSERSAQKVAAAIGVIADIGAHYGLPKAADRSPSLPTSDEVTPLTVAHLNTGTLGAISDSQLHSFGFTACLGPNLSPAIINDGILNHVTNQDGIHALRNAIQHITLPPDLASRIANAVDATHQPERYGITLPKINSIMGRRATSAIAQGARVRALAEERSNVIVDDINQTLVLAAMCHCVQPVDPKDAIEDVAQTIHGATISGQR